MDLQVASLSLSAAVTARGELTLYSSLSTILRRGLDLNSFKQQDIWLLAFCEVNAVQLGD